MIEIVNKKKHSVQLVVRSQKNPKAFTTLNVPGVGAGNNVVYLEDEYYTEYLDRIASWNLISKKQVTNKPNKGE